MEKLEQHKKLNITWVEDKEEKKWIPVTNYKPVIKLKEQENSSEDESEEESESSSENNSDTQTEEIKDKIDTVDLEKINEQSLVYHETLGYLRIITVDYDDEGKKKQFECRKLVDGKETEEAVTIEVADIIKLKENIKIFGKVVLVSQETNEFSQTLSIHSEISDITYPLDIVCGQKFSVFANGKILKPEQTIAEANLKDQSKILLYGIAGKLKPEGVREFIRFPKHNTTDY